MEEIDDPDRAAVFRSQGAVALHPCGEVTGHSHITVYSIACRVNAPWCDPKQG
jgi:hypothetical protein